jgi:hypothetical protein
MNRSPADAAAPRIQSGQVESRAAASGKIMVTSALNPVRAFVFERDTFAYAHELVWQYRFDPATGRTTTFNTDPPPTYYHRCFVMVRSVRQFFYHARFAPELPVAEVEVYRNLVREIVSRNPRRPGAESQRLTIPGYDGLRALSRAHEPLLKAECGASWESYFLRSHWRMIFPVIWRHRQRMVRRLKRALPERGIVPVHLFRFPRITINHGIVLYGMSESERTIEFDAYDPNIPAHPVKLVYERATKKFIFPPTCYWGGGPLNVTEIYRGGLY